MIRLSIHCGRLFFHMIYFMVSFRHRWTEKEKITEEEVGLARQGEE